MGSFALYAKIDRDNTENNKDEEKQELVADIHFNLWNVSDSNQLFLDIGIMLENLDSRHSVFLYCPFSVKQEDISDLGNLLSRDNRLLNAVFNENYSLLNRSKPKWAEVLTDSSPTPIFSIFTLDIGNNLTVQSMTTGGTKIQITIPSASTGEPYPKKIYVRFRIKSSKKQVNLIRGYKNAVAFLTGLVKECYVVDFRYNDTRSFSDTELEEFTTDGKGFVETRKLHFLLLCKAYIDVECSGDVKKREIEEGIWQEYVDHIDTTDIIAYHISAKTPADKEKKDIGSWEFFAKQSVDFLGSRRAAKLLFWMIVIGCIINGTYDCLKSFASLLRYHG